MECQQVLYVKEENPKGKKSHVAVATVPLIPSSARSVPYNLRILFKKHQYQ